MVTTTKHTEVFIQF